MLHSGTVTPHSEYTPFVCIRSTPSCLPKLRHTGHPPSSHSQVFRHPPYATNPQSKSPTEFYLGTTSDSQTKTTLNSQGGRSTDEKRKGMGKPRLIILIRHGESEGNCDKSINCHIPNHLITLTARGHKQASQAGTELKSLLTPGDSVLFYTSPYKRTRQTLEGIKSELSDVKYKVYEEPRMREQDFGNFQSDSAIMEKIWLERAHYGHFFYRIPYGESAADVYDRVSGFNETLFRQFQGDEFPSVLVLITHGIWARVFLMKWYRWTYEEFESLKNVPHCQLIKMERDDRGKFKLKTKLYKWDEEENEGSAESSYEKELRKEKERELRERFNR